MKVVIDIPENDYKLACNYPDALIACYAHYIKAGVPLPEKHGRLIDADAFAERIKSIIKRQGYDDLEMDKFLTVGDVLNAVIADLKGMTLYGSENAPTVIEAEGVEE